MASLFPIVLLIQYQSQVGQKGITYGEEMEMKLWDILEDACRYALDHGGPTFWLAWTIL